MLLVNHALTLSVTARSVTHPANPQPYPWWLIHVSGNHADALSVAYRRRLDNGTLVSIKVASLSVPVAFQSLGYPLLVFQSHPQCSQSESLSVFEVAVRVLSHLLVFQRHPQCSEWVAISVSSHPQCFESLSVFQVTPSVLSHCQYFKDSHSVPSQSCYHCFKSLSVFWVTVNISKLSHSIPSESLLVFQVTLSVWSQYQCFRVSHSVRSESLSVFQVTLCFELLLVFLKFPTAFRISYYQCVKSLSVFWVTVSVSKTLTVFRVRIAINVLSHWCQCFKSLSVFQSHPQCESLSVFKATVSVSRSHCQCFRSVFQQVTANVSSHSSSVFPVTQYTESPGSQCVKLLLVFQVTVTASNPCQ